MFWRRRTRLTTMCFRTSVSPLWSLCAFQPLSFALLTDFSIVILEPHIATVQFACEILALHAMLARLGRRQWCFAGPGLPPGRLRRAFTAFLAVSCHWRRPQHSSKPVHSHPGGAFLQFVSSLQRRSGMYWSRCAFLLQGGVGDCASLAWSSAGCGLVVVSLSALERVDDGLHARVKCVAKFLLAARNLFLS